MDLKRKMVAKVEIFDIQDKGLFSGVFGKVKPENTREPNQFEVKICKFFDGTEVAVCEGSGLWTRFVQFDKQVYWRVSDPVDSWVFESEATALPSSSLNRKELGLIAERKFAEADKFG